MLRNLLAVFVVGLFISIACFAGAAALGGSAFRNGGWPGHIRFEGDSDGKRTNLGDPTAQATRTLTWDGSDSLQINVPAKVSYTQGTDAKVIITGPGNWIDRIVIENGEISFDRDHIDWSSGDNDRSIAIVVQAPSVTRFELNGAQDMDIAGYDQDSLDLQINGAAKIRAAGRAKAMTIELNGASKANLEDLANDDAEVELNGASSITLAPKLSSDIEINGVGKARVLSRPASTRQAIHGFGSITYGDARGKDKDWDDDGSDSKAAAAPALPPSPIKPVKPVKPQAPVKTEKAAAA